MRQVRRVLARLGFEGSLVSPNLCLAGGSTKISASSTKADSAGSCRSHAANLWMMSFPKRQITTLCLGASHRRINSNVSSESLFLSRLASICARMSGGRISLGSNSFSAEFATAKKWPPA